MTPIDDELRTTLQTRAQTAPVSADMVTRVEARARGLRRRRVTAVVTATAVAGVVAVGVAVAVQPSGSHRLSPGEGPPTPTASASATAGVDTAPKPLNLLGWPARGDTPTEDPAKDAGRRLWAERHGVAPADVHVAPLWHGALATDSVVSVFQAWSYDADSGDIGVANTVVYQRLRDGTDFLVRDEPTMFDAQQPGEPVSATKYEVSRIRQISAVVQGDAVPYVVVIGAPGTGQVRYSDDAGATFRPVETVEGVAVFQRSRQVAAGGDLIQVLNGDGDVDHPDYQGPIDTGPAGSDG